MEEATREEWAGLFQVTAKYQQVMPWEWMENDHVFAVETPDYPEPGYCCILGAGQEEFGLGIYFGIKGYKGYIELLTSEVDPVEFNENMDFASLVLLLVDRKILQKKDFEVIRSLELKFRGKNAWPMFRCQLPGYAPWYLEKRDVHFMSAALEQALVVSEKVRKKEINLSQTIIKNRIFTRFLEQDGWHEDWRIPLSMEDSVHPQPESLNAVAEAQLLLFRNSMSSLKGTWEVDLFTLPVNIKEDSERPAFPLCLLIAESSRGIILSFEALESWLTMEQKQQKIIQVLKDLRRHPREIKTRSSHTRRLIEPISESLGISFKQGATPNLDRIKKEIYDRFVK